MALGYLRTASKSIWAKVLLILLGLSFAVWGVGDIFRGNQDRAVAVVGGTEIGVQDFADQYNREVQMMSNEIGQRVTPDMAQSMGLTQQVLNKMISQVAIKRHAKTLGVTASDTAVKDAIYAIDAFKGVGARFDRQVYENVLRQNQINRLKFEDSVRGDIMRGQVVDVVASGFATPKSMAELIFKFRAERRQASYILLAPDLVGQIETPEEEVLIEFHQSNSPLFTKPEFREAAYFVVKPSDFLNSVSITDEDVAQLYERRLPQFTTPESRMVKRLFGSQEEITVAVNRAAVGESFESIGESLGMTPQEINLGSIQIDGINDPKVAEAAFAMERPGISQPIEGALSWSLIQVTEIKPEKIQPLEEVGEELRSDLADREATDVLFAQIDAIEEEIASGTPLEEIAARVGIEASKIAQISAAGEDFYGNKIDGLPTDAKFLREVFASSKGFESDLIEMEDNEYFVLRVDNIMPSAVTPYVQAKNDVLSKWRQMERSNRLEALARDIVERGNNGTSLETLGDELGRGVLASPTPLNRTQTNDMFSGQAVGQLFMSEVGELTFSQVGVGNSLIVSRLDEIIEADVEEGRDIVSAFQEQISEAISNDMIEQYLRGLTNRYGVQRNENAILIATGVVQPNQ
jgi:peptidyl-prolyl cis-trans isomerase D